MNAIVVQHGAARALPAPSPALSHALDRIQGKRDDGLPLFGRRYPVPLIDEAKGLLAQYNPRPLTIAALASWLGPVNLLVRNPLTPVELEGVVPALLSVLDHLPAQAFTDAGRRRLLAVCAFFPSPADITAAIQPDVNKIGFTRTALKFVAEAKPLEAPEPDRVVPVSSIVSAVSRKFLPPPDAAAAPAVPLPFPAPVQAARAASRVTR